MMGKPNGRPTCKQSTIADTTTNGSKSRKESATLPEIFVNIYHVSRIATPKPSQNQRHFKATLVGRHIPYTGLLQLSQLFAKTAPTPGSLPAHPNEPDTRCWDLPDLAVSLAGATAFFTWTASLHLPLSEAFLGQKRMPLDSEWGILQWRSLYEVMAFVELGPRFTNINVRDKIFEWLRAESDEITTEHLVKIWRRAGGDESLRKMVVHHAVDYADRRGVMVEYEDVFRDREEEMWRMWRVRWEEKEAWKKRRDRDFDRRYLR